MEQVHDRQIDRERGRQKDETIYAHKQTDESPVSKESRTVVTHWKTERKVKENLEEHSRVRKIH